MGLACDFERTHVNPLLALRTGVCNDRWEETMQQASRQRLLTRRSLRVARQKKKDEQRRQKVKRLLLRLFLCRPHPQFKTGHLPASAPQRERLAASSGTPGSADTRRPAPSHPWRRYPHAKK